MYICSACQWSDYFSLLARIKPDYLTLQTGDKITLTETVKCPYCGEVFEGEDEIEARTQEGIHRAENHVNEGESTSKAKKGRNIIDEWKTEGRKA